MKMIFRMLVFTCMVIVVASCSEQENERDITKLRIGILPDENMEKLLERYSSLFDYLSHETGLPYEIVIPVSYQELLEKFSSRQVDLAYFGGYTFLKAHHEFGFLVRSNESLQDITDFRNKTIGFGSRLSTSGHLMPRYFLYIKGIEPEKFFSHVVYSGKHDTTAYWVRDGKIDLGAANSDVIDKMIQDGRLDLDNDVRILWETPPYADYVWASQPDINNTIRSNIINAFLSLSPDNPEHAEILYKIGSGGFLPASVTDFAELESVKMELIPVE